uniref:F-box domain-containing protein n=1 Tax=viral metagenome TaxID=1070528 RepID=A0A6C0C9S0_9ZZZZ
MLSLCQDTILYIAEYLPSNNDKMALSSICIKMDTLKYKFIYHGRVYAKDIENLSYKYNFKHVFRRASCKIISDLVTHLEFSDEFNDSIYKFPPRLSYLSFGRHFNKSVDSFP